MRLGRLRFGLLPTLVGAAGLVALGVGPTVTAHAADDTLIKYNGNSRDYWEHPPADWFMGDETVQQHGTHPYPGQPLPTPHDELVGLVKDNIKLSRASISKSWPVTSTASARWCSAATTRSMPAAGPTTCSR